MATIEVYQGANRTYRITVVDTDGVAVDLTGATIVFTVRKTVTCEPHIIRKATDTPSEGQILSPETDGIAEIYLVPADTGRTLPGDYKYDLWVDDLAPSSTRQILIEPATFRVLDPVRSWPDT